MNREIEICNDIGCADVNCPHCGIKSEKDMDILKNQIKTLDRLELEMLQRYIEDLLESDLKFYGKISNEK